MLDFVLRLVKSKTFHTLMLIVTGAAVQVLRGECSIQAAALVVAAALAGIFMVNAMKKGFEMLAAKGWLSPETVAKVEELADEVIVRQIAAHQGALVTHAVAHGVDEATAERMAATFVSQVKGALPGAPSIAGAAQLALAVDAIGGPDAARAALTKPAGQ